nr:MAG TPA: hypothetical protein [Caudoviricetes sp.]
MFFLKNTAAPLFRCQAKNQPSQSIFLFSSHRTKDSSPKRKNYLIF